MPKTNPFDQHSQAYDLWFDKHQHIYATELKAIAECIPSHGVGLEIGVGSGRFAQPLGIGFGVEPARNMAAMATRRGVMVVQGVAEVLPFKDCAFDYILMMTSICFMESVACAFSEAHRVLQETGIAVVAMINRDSTLGKTYYRKKSESLFYKDACFYSVPEVTALMNSAGFNDFTYQQILIDELSEKRAEITITDGYDQGGIVVVCGRKR